MPPDTPPEKILVYLGPSLALEKAKAILPDAIYHRPACQSDILSDVVNLNPNIILLVDAEIRQNLSPWHKELVYALQYPSVKAVYGAASMGALRAAELDYLGMIGVGQIYRWYRDGVTEDDSEVVLNYSAKFWQDGWLYRALSVPLVDIRAGVEHYEREFHDQPEILNAVRNFFQAMRSVYYMDRTQKRCEEFWGNHLGISFPYIPQKELDAIELLTNFRQYHSEPPKAKLTPEHLPLPFQALYDRDRKIQIGSELIPQQHIDSYLLLHNPEYERICWDSANQELALVLCDTLLVMVTLEEVERESNRFQQRCGLETMEDFSHMLESNGWTRGEYDRLMVQNARIHKLQHSLTVSKHSRRNTRAILDYLRTHQGFDYWAKQTAEKEAAIAREGIDDWKEVDFTISPWKMLTQHLDREGLELKCSHEEYLLETGFSTEQELSVALNRLMATKEN